MAQPRIPGMPLKYSGMIDCAREVWRAEGPRAFVSGFVPGLGRSFVANAAGFTAFELGLRFLPQQLQ
jgi:solute carrier family 25 carnitine/acylcarnitine transporter 20/29